VLLRDCLALLTRQERPGDTKNPIRRLGSGRRRAGPITSGSAWRNPLSSADSSGPWGFRPTATPRHQNGRRRIRNGRRERIDENQVRFADFTPRSPIRNIRLLNRCKTVGVTRMLSSTRWLRESHHASWDWLLGRLHPCLSNQLRAFQYSILVNIRCQRYQQVLFGVSGNPYLVVCLS